MDEKYIKFNIIFFIRLSFFLECTSDSDCQNKEYNDCAVYIGNVGGTFCANGEDKSNITKEETQKLKQTFENLGYNTCVAIRLCENY